MVAAVVGRETNDNGNLQSVTTYAGGPAALSSLPAFTTTFGYDGVNRLSTANDTGGWSRTYGYDPYGNMWVTGYSGVTPPGNMPTSNVYGNNRINGASYDSTGNQTVVSGDTLAYDAENRLVSAYDPVTHGTETYVYDGDGGLKNPGRAARRPTFTMRSAIWLPNTEPCRAIRPAQRAI